MYSASSLPNYGFITKWENLIEFNAKYSNPTLITIL